MNWGYKLTIVFIAFAGFMGTMVYKCMKSPISLVSADYYKDELKYQQVIDGSERAKTLSSPVSVNIENELITLQLPAEMKQVQSGHVWFYCINKSNNDRKAALSLDEEGRQQFALSMLSAGRYVVKVDWVADGVNYYSEKEITIQ